MAESRFVHSGGMPSNEKIYEIDVANLGLTEGTNEITAKISANGYIDSDYSNKIVITVSESGTHHSGGTGS